MKRTTRKQGGLGDDPVTAAVRRARAKALKQAGGTLRGFAKSLQREQEELEAAGKIRVRRASETRRPRKRRAA